MQIAIYAFDGVPMFHLSAPLTVFEEVRRQGLAEWNTRIVADVAGPVRMAEGFSIAGVGAVDELGDIDLVVVPSWYEDGRAPSLELRQLLLAAHRRGARVAGLCMGALPVVDVGLLDGRSAVTHWHVIDALQQRRPAVHVDPSVLYIDYGDVLTSAGTASAIDACLHMVRRELGAAAASAVARSLVVAPHRDGGQAQYVKRPLPEPHENNPLAATLQWALEHLEEDLSVDQLATHAHLSRRTFVRAFQERAGTTPAAWVRSRRLDESRRLLEETDLPIDQVAARAGFGSAITMRQNFQAAFATTPSAYRRRFTATGS